jgi:flagellar basal-body rod protein FlgB
MDVLREQLNLVESYLGSRLSAHKIHASNIANADTPGFKAVQPDFSAKLEKHLDGSKWNIDLKLRPTEDSAKLDGNNVSIEKEMGKLSENSLQYMTGIKVFSKHMALLSYAISSGGR